MTKKYGTKQYFDKVGPHLYIGNAGRKGRGVFTDSHIPKNFTVETAPILVIDVEEGDSTYFDGVIYEFAEDNRYALGLGYASLYNHSNKPNADYELFIEDGQPGIELWAIRDIKAGQEITINYNGDPKDKTPWEF